MKVGRSLAWVGSATILGALGACFLVSNGVTEYYSPGWHSETTENAKYRGVFVASPVVLPARLTLGDSVELRITDAWVERPTRVEYRWLVRRREVRDSSYRLIVNYVQVPRDDVAWTYERGRCFVYVELSVDGRHAASSGNGFVETAELISVTPIPDTVRLTARIPAAGSGRSDSACPGV